MSDLSGVCGYTPVKALGLGAPPSGAMELRKAWSPRRAFVRKTVVAAVAATVLIALGVPPGALVLPARAQQMVPQTPWVVFAGPDQLNEPNTADIPSGVAVDKQGNVYVSIPFRASVEKLGPDGSRLALWGPLGAGPTEPARAIGGVAVDGQGNIYVAATVNEHIQKLSPSGQPLALWGAYGNTAGAFAGLTNVAVDSQANVYAADASNSRIQKFGPNGVLLALWGLFGRDGSPIVGGLFGVGGPNRFDYPEGVAVDSEGSIFVADTKNHRIQKLSPSGQPVAQWATQRSAPGQLYGPIGVAVDGQGNVYVAGDPLQKLSPSGQPLPLPAPPTEWGGLKSAGVAVDGQGNLYVTSGNRILKLAAAATATNETRVTLPDVTPPPLKDTLPQTEIGQPIRDLSGGGPLGEGGAQGAPDTLTDDEQAGILAALDRANDVWVQALQTLDSSVLSAGVAGQLLEVDLAELDQLRRQGRTMKNMNTDFTVASVTLDTPGHAFVQTSETWYTEIYDRATGELLERAPSATYSETYTVEYLNGGWIVTKDDIRRE